MRKRVYAACLAALLLASDNSHAPPASELASRWVSSGRTTVAFPVGEQVDSVLALEMVGAVEEALPVPGMPAPHASLDSLLITLISDVSPGIEARAAPRAGAIIVSIERARQWSAAELNKVIKHEVAHVVLGKFLDHQTVPFWFDEGFAEWTVGGVSREGTERIQKQLASAGPPRSVAVPVSSPHSRLAYDFYGAFFEFLASDSGDALVNGNVVSALRDTNSVEALETITGQTFSQLEEAWQQYLIREYAGNSQRRSVHGCSPPPEKQEEVFPSSKKGAQS